MIKIFLWFSKQASKMHMKFSISEQWVLDQTSIFAQVDAFVQRCKDLLEVLSNIFITLTTFTMNVHQFSEQLMALLYFATSSLSSVTQPRCAHEMHFQEPVQVTRVWRRVVTAKLSDWKVRNLQCGLYRMLRMRIRDHPRC